MILILAFYDTFKTFLISLLLIAFLDYNVVTQKDYSTLKTPSTLRANGVNLLSSILT